MPHQALMLVRITRSWKPELTDQQVYDVARRWWRTTPDRTEQVDRVLAVADGRVAAAYTPSHWEQSPIHEPARFGFRGSAAPDADAWVGRDVSHLFPKGAANPVRYASSEELDAAKSSVRGETGAAEPLILVLRLSREWSPDLTPRELYDATRHWWTIASGKTSQIGLVLAVGEGVVREAYLPKRWEHSTVTGWEHRLGFDGGVAPDRDRWVGLEVHHLFKPGSANPVRYLRAEDFEAADDMETGQSLSTEELVREAEGEEPGLVEQVAPVLEQLAGDLLWSMSQSAQELFHSNTLGWLIQHRPEAMQPVIELLHGAFPDAGVVTAEVWREHRQLDLVVDAGLTDRASASFVVENKCYSIPTPEQLVSYLDKALPWQEKAHPDDARWTLLSLMPPTFELPPPWRLVTYAELARALDRVNAAAMDADPGSSALTAPTGSLFQRYRTLVHRLVELATVVDPSMSLDAPFEAAELLGHVARTKFRGPIQRLRFSGLASLVQQRMRQPQDVRAGFQHGHGLAEWFTDVGDGVQLGWQLQERQLRQALRVRKDHRAHGRGADAKQRRTDLSSTRFGAYFDLAPAERVLGRRLLPGTEKTSTWKHFAPDFIYRYRKVDAAVSTDQLADGLVGLTTWALDYAERHHRATA